MTWCYAPAIAKSDLGAMNWTALDFMVFGALLGIAAALYYYTARRTKAVAYRAGLAIALLAAFGLIWVNGAVGIIGNEGNPANLLFLGVLAVAAAGSFACRYQAGGMARAMVAAAGAQVFAALIALVLRLGATASAWPGDIFVITTTFTAAWLLAALLFKASARQETT